MSRIMFVIASVTAGLSTVSSPARAQTLWSDPTTPQSVWIEVNHPKLGEGSGALSSNLFLGGRGRLSDEWSIVGEIPFGYADLDLGNSEFGAGNPYLGLEYAPRANLLVEMGARAPLASETNNGATVGEFAEIVDRFGSFLSDYVPARVAVNSLPTFGDNSHARLRGGLLGLIPTGGGDAELLVELGGTIGFESSQIGVDVGLNGWIVLTSDGDLGERSVTQFGAQVYHRFAAGNRIALLLRVPLDEDYRRANDFTVGVSASFIP